MSIFTCLTLLKSFLNVFYINGLDSAASIEAHLLNISERTPSRRSLLSCLTRNCSSKHDQFYSQSPDWSQPCGADNRVKLRGIYTSVTWPITSAKRLTVRPSIVHIFYIPRSSTPKTFPVVCVSDTEKPSFNNRNVFCKYYRLFEKFTSGNFCSRCRCESHLNTEIPVASLGWVTPGAATEGVTPLFFPEKPGDLFLLIAITITPRGCHPTPFLPVQPRFSTILL